MLCLKRSWPLHKYFVWHYVIPLYSYQSKCFHLKFMNEIRIKIKNEKIGKKGPSCRLQYIMIWGKKLLIRFTYISLYILMCCQASKNLTLSRFFTLSLSLYLNLMKLLTLELDDICYSFC